MQDRSYRNHRLFQVRSPHSSVSPECIVLRERQIVLCSYKFPSVNFRFSDVRPGVKNKTPDRFCLSRANKLYPWCHLDSQDNVLDTQLSLTGLPVAGYLISPAPLQGAFIFPYSAISHQPWLSVEIVKNYYSFSLCYENLNTYFLKRQSFYTLFCKKIKKSSAEDLFMNIHIRFQTTRYMVSDGI